MQNVPRLIEKFKPNSYILSLDIDRLSRKFDGQVTIHGETNEILNNVTLHSKDLNIVSVSVDGKKAKFTFGENDALEIIYQNLAAGPHAIVITYEGKITDSMHGMYPCHFSHNGVEKELIATQFESHYAREVLPCIDEPEAKATYEVTLTTEPDVTVLGNMPVKEQKISDNRMETIFETTPVMSSYLLAWVIGEMHKKTAYSKNGVEVNVWATPAQPADNLDFALDIATRSIDFFDEYFGTPYPLKKCDHVALPDFSSGAMENWGLITYREIALLVDPVTSSITSRHYVATVIAHELSHQWFGNLVTMKWWNDLWLNESFATLIEYIAVDNLEPKWDMWLDFVSYNGVIALKRDSLPGVQPVQVEVNHPDEISTLFDSAIVYAKGARLLQMLHNYIGEDAFRAGLKQYFHDHAYANTEAADLWKALSDSSGKDIASFMNTWIKQPGYPVLHVEHDNNQINLSQNRLSYDANNIYDEIWPIPLNTNNPELPAIFDKPNLSIANNNDSPTYFNIGNKAHYVVNYPFETISLLLEKVANKQIEPVDRLQLLNHQVILANAGIISSSSLIPTLNSYKNEDVESVWSIIASAISELKKFVEHDTEIEKKLRKFVGQLAAEQYKRLNWYEVQNEPDTDSKLRGIIISLMVYSEDSEVLSTAMNIFNSIAIEEITPELRPLIISATVRHSDEMETFESLLKTYGTTESAELKNDITMGVTSTRNMDYIAKLLACIKDVNFVKTQDTIRWVVHLLRNKTAQETTWQWIRDNWTWISDTFGGDKSYDYFPRYIANVLSTDKQLQEYIDFFKPLSANPALTRVVEVGINEISSRIESIARDRSAVQEQLQNF